MSQPAQSRISYLKSTLLLQARLLRRAARRLVQMARYRKSSLAEAPIFFGNSFPKSGTHLLTQVMLGFTRLGPVVDSGLPAIVTFEGDTGRQRDEGEILVDFQRLLPGDVAYGHVHALPSALAFLCREGVVSYFILRDPRDVAVSHAHYVAGMAKNFIHGTYYQEVLKSFDERLSASIAGFSSSTFPGSPLTGSYSQVSDSSLPDIRQRFEPYMGWLDHPEVLVLHYEEFIAARQPALEKVLHHAVQRGFGFSCAPETAIQILSQSIDPARSPTFRSGKIGDWRTSFTTEHISIFKEVTGDLLIRLGYEQNNDW
jgi:hypothetical protein